MIKVVHKYQADDGTIHDSMEAAYKYDALQKVMARTKKIFQDVGLNTSTAYLDFVNNPQIASKMREAMNRVLDYHRRYGKLKK